MVKVLGVSASLRNARFGAGSDRLIEDIAEIKSELALRDYLLTQTKIRADDFIEAGRAEGIPFDQIFRNLRKSRNDQGLSNSEAALVAGLWAAQQEGAEIRHIGLSLVFPYNGAAKDTDQLKDLILSSDGILVSGPVYFGDRGSLAQSFFEFLRDDEEVRNHLRGKVYGGIAVGAKRNGGQETTLIYQLIDAINLDMVGVGNDASTTSQYGGTAVAGDVGTFASDEYGLKTSIGTGMRVANVAKLMEAGKRYKLKDKTRIAIWLLQDDATGTGLGYIKELCKEIESASVSIEILDFTEGDIVRCIACDICPTSTGKPEEYRCIIKSKNDILAGNHAKLLQNDAIIVAAYSPSDRAGLKSAYQHFVERTRYIRRDDYSIGNRLIAPLVISDLNARQNLHLRMVTSFIRHNSVMHHPLIGMEMDGKVINREVLSKQMKNFAEMAEQITVGRLSGEASDTEETHYNAVGYSISMEKRLADEEAGLTAESDDIRRKSKSVERNRRLALIE